MRKIFPDNRSAALQADTLRRAFAATLPVMAGYVVLGIAFGILLRSKGYGAGWALLMSVTIFAGSMQFVGVSLISGGASLLSAAFMTLFVNARHLFYGISMLKRYRSTGAAKPYLIFGLTDETYALVVNGAPEGADEKTYYFFVTLLDHCWWVLGSVLGSLIGTAIPFETQGIDFAMTALFVTIFTEQFLSMKDHFPAAAGVAASLACLLVFGPDRFLIPSMLVIAVSLGLYGVKKRRSAS